MYTVRVDPHTHTIASIHAFGTIGENARVAHERGMEAISMSDHFGPGFIAQMDGRPAFTASFNMHALPPVIEGVRVLASAEVDIVDLEGQLYCHNTPFVLMRARRSLTACCARAISLSPACTALTAREAAASRRTPACSSAR